MKGANKPSNDPTLAGLDETDAATNEEAITLPLFAGEQLLKLHWIMDTANQFTKEVASDSAKK